MPAPFSLPERLRPRSIRAKVVTLLAVPVVSLMALWGHAAVTTASQVSDTEQLKQVNSELVRPISDFTSAVQDERAAALAYLATPGATTGAHYASAKSRTNQAVSELHAGIRSSSTDLAGLDASLPGRVGRLLSSADRLDGRKASGIPEAFADYGDTVDRAFAVRSALVRADRGSSTSDARPVLELARAREALSRQDAVLGAARAAHGMDAAQYREFVGDVALQRSLVKSARPDLTAGHAAAYDAVLKGTAANHLTAAQDAVLDAGPVSATGAAGTTGATGTTRAVRVTDATDAVPAASWRSAAGNVLTGLDRAERSTIATGSTAAPYSLATLGSSGLAVALGLLGVVLSLLLSVHVGRGLVADLTGLRNRALDLAATRLPSAMRRIHNGENVDLDAEAPPTRTPVRDEIGQVDAALTTVQRAALRAVAGRAAVLTGVSGVYVSLARRSQVLLHQQLDLLDAMERRTENPADLEDLFRIDHLTSRMRRHAESLLILSGSAPGRAWRNPVPLIDAVRAGIAETADIERVRLQDFPDLHLTGAAVADLVHLVAELTENAQRFSPPHTQVVVRGEQVGAGAVLEIEDRGLGMGEESLAAANAKLRAEDIDLLDSRQLGLFVVNRLAERLGVEVTLRHSVYGGVTAVVFLPQRILEAPSPTRAGGTERPGLSERHGQPERLAQPEWHGQPEQSVGYGQFEQLGHQEQPVRPGEAAHPEEAPRPAPGALSTNPTARPVPTTGPEPAHRAEPTRPERTHRAEPTAHPEPAPRPEPVTRPDEPLPTAGPATRPTPAEPGTPARPDTLEGLPRRVRQANLAPELRSPDPRTAHPHDAGSPGGGGRRLPEPPGRRSPEAARATMTSLRSGRHRARTLLDPTTQGPTTQGTPADDAPVPGTRTAAPAPAPTPAGSRADTPAGSPADTPTPTPTTPEEGRGHR